MITMVPILLDEDKTKAIYATPDCQEIFKYYPDYYYKVGYNEPWIGYFATLDGHEMVGCGGFKGKPRDGKVEIAYGTFKKYEGQKIGTEICRQLVLLSLQTDASIRITARTFLENNASTQILKHNGFECIGIVFDEEDGNVWEWELKKTSRGA
jgi:ribosomal-protein-alanine N-acetyltransferase